MAVAVVAAATCAVSAFWLPTGPAAAGRTATTGPAAAARTASGAAPAPGTMQPGAGQHSTTTPIAHFIFLMQGGRTFDNYFGSYPGADGIPKGTCEPLVAGRPQDDCVKPFPLHGRQSQPVGAGRTIITNQYDNGKMDGFVSAYERQGRDGTSAMGYYGRADLPFYWGVADNYVLFDHFFSAAPYGIRTNRSYWVAAAPSPGGTEQSPLGGYGDNPTIFDRLQAAGISWKFYVQGYNPKQTYRSASQQNPDTQTIRVPLLNYARFIDDPALHGHIVDLDQYYRDLAAGTLPAVAYVASSDANERSARSIPAGQDLVRNMVTQLMTSRYWPHSALMWSYDGSGGWYDHVAPPRAGSSTLGFRVPGLLVSAYAQKGQVNHTVLGYPSVLKFIEQNWRLAPLGPLDASATSLAVSAANLPPGSLGSVFDFTAGPRKAEIIPGSPASSAQQHHLAVRAAMIYWLYGGAIAAAVLLVLVAAVLPVLTGRRRNAVTPGAGRQDVTVP